MKDDRSTIIATIICYLLIAVTWMYLIIVSIVSGA